MNWFLYAIGAAILWGLGYTINQITLRKFTAVELLFFESIVVGVVLGVYMIINLEMPTFISKITDYKNLIIISASCLIYTIASIFIFKSISSSNASLAAIIESCYPAFTVLFSLIIFGKQNLNPFSLIGFIAIFIGIIIVKIYS